jgi:excisionase family DNA binding protein
MHEATEMEALMTPQETAGCLRVSEDTLATWRCSGRQNLPFVKVGSLVRYRRADVETYVHRRSQSAASVELT